MADAPKIIVNTFSTQCVDGVSVNLIFERQTMKSKILMTMVCAVVLAGTSGIASAKGCIKGAAAGAVAGHYAGHHAVVGAIGGCIVGRHLANKKAAEQKTHAVDAAAPIHTDAPAPVAAPAQ